MQPHLDQPLDPEAAEAGSTLDEVSSIGEAAPAGAGDLAPAEDLLGAEPVAVMDASVIEPLVVDPGAAGTDQPPSSSDESVDTADAVEAVAETADDEHIDDDVASDEPGSAADAAAEPALPSTVAELIAATLRAAGVRIAFTVPGESFLPVLDALHAAGIRVVATRHEGGAAFAAEAYGQLTGRPAACLGTRAVGAANLAIGIHTATADSTPMFVLVGQVDRSVRGREAFQEVDLVGTIGRLAKWAGEIDDPATAAATLEAAVRATVEGRPGPALLALPEDVLHLEIPEGTRAPVVRAHPDVPATGDVRAVLHMLAAAERPVILAGAGVLRARCSNDLVRFAELLHVPVIAAWRRGDVVPNDHALYLGMAGYGSPARRRGAAPDGRRPARHRLPAERGDDRRVHAAGARASAGCTWTSSRGRPPSATRPRPNCAIRADARAFLRAAVARLKEAVLVAAPVAARDGHNGADRAAWEAAAEVDGSAWDGPGVHPGRIVAELRRLLPDDAILTTDAGAFGGWAARGFRFRRPGHVPRPDLGRDGLRLPGGARGRARPPRAAGGRAARRRRHGHDAGRGRDGGSRGRPGHRDRVRQRAVRDDPRPPGPRGEPDRRPARTSGRSTSPPPPVPAGRAACGSTPTRRSSPPCGPPWRPRGRR